MKKLVTFCILLCSLTTCALCQKKNKVPQNFIDSLNYREYDGNYYFPVDSNEVTLDVFRLNSDSTDVVSVDRNVIIRSFVEMGYTVYDIAQSFYTDTAMRIYGVSIPFWRLQYRNMHPYVCIADSNFVIQKKVAIFREYDGTDSVSRENSYGFFRYKEVFFDKPVKVKGQFYVILDNPKPAPYTGYNWDEASSKDAGIDLVMQPCTPNPNGKIFNLSRNVHITTQHVDFESKYTDTSWHNKSESYFMCMFPILCPQKEQGDTTHHGSGLENIDINGYTYIYPNPAKYELNISCPVSINKIEIFNNAGQKNEEIQTKGYNHTVNLTKYAKGEYIIKIYTDYGTVVKPFIKE